MTTDRIHPPAPLTSDSQLALLREFARTADWEEWETADEIVHNGSLITFFVTLGAKKNSPWTYTFNFRIEQGRWYYRFLEGIVLRLDKVMEFPADAASFPDSDEERKMWMREEIYWSEQVRLFNYLSREKGKEEAFKWIGDGIANGAGYALAATVWIPFYETPLAFILYLCWEQAGLYGNTITLEKLEEKEAIIRFDDLIYFSLYMRTSHLKQQISLEDYIKIFETIWTGRAKAAGWDLKIDGKGRQIYLHFTR